MKYYNSRLNETVSLEEMDKGKWDAIAELMDDDIREDVHMDMAPCTREEFLDEYLKRDPNYWTVIEQAFCQWLVED